MLNVVKNNEFLNLFERVFGNDLDQHLYVESCLFIRENSDFWEEGLLVNSGEKLIDFDAEEVGDIENIKITEVLLIDVENIQFDY